MNENKTNTLLLTVIGVATLLVAVIGATFAYFTATINQDTGDTSVYVGAGVLTIDYGATGDEVTYGVNTSGGTQVFPQETTPGTNPYGDPIATKVFTVTGNNNTNSTMPYTLELEVTNNTFDAEALKMTLATNGATGAAPAITTAVDIPATSDTSQKIDICSSANPCLFIGKTTGDGITHQYTLKIHYPSTTDYDQDVDKGKVFSAKVNIKEVAAYTTTAS